MEKDRRDPGFSRLTPPRAPRPRSPSSLHPSYKMSILKADKTQGEGERTRERERVSERERRESPSCFEGGGEEQ